jgi:hypothetical protein
MFHFLPQMSWEKMDKGQNAGLRGGLLPARGEMREDNQIPNDGESPIDWFP